MSSRETIENIILKYEICEYVFGDVESLVFTDKVWTICETDCERYGHSWACPPHCGVLADNIARCRSFQHFCLFSTVTETANAWDVQEKLRVKKKHEEITRQIKAEVDEQQAAHFVLSTGCTTCEVCACPDEPCRHPEQRLSSMESHGMLVLQNVAEAGLCADYGEDTVVYFSMILYNEG